MSRRDRGAADADVGVAAGSGERSALLEWPDDLFALTDVSALVLTKCVPPDVRSACKSPLDREAPSRTRTGEPFLTISRSVECGQSQPPPTWLLVRLSLPFRALSLCGR